jgi:hypothetical protein
MSKILLNKSNIDLDYPICRPSLDLDFTQEVLDERITFSRGSIGTRVNRNRLIETVAANQPRFDYDPVTGECKGLLIEESRQNLLLRSEDFTTSWAPANASVQSNIITAPDGNITADKLVENSSTGNKEVTQGSITFTSGTSLTFSCFVKAGERTLFRLAATTGFFASQTNAYFNLTSGTVSLTQGGITSASIIPYPNGWYRCIATMLPTSSGTGNVFITLVRSGTTTNYTGDGTSGIYIWGAQLETGAFPTSYIPTTASTVTRSADLANMTGNNFSSWYNQTEGTTYLSFVPNYAGATTFKRYFTINPSTYSQDNVIQLIAIEGSNQVQMAVWFNSVFQAGANLTVRSGAEGKIAYSLKQNSAVLAGNGSILQNDTACILPTNMNRMDIGGYGGIGGYQSSGCYKRITYYPRALKPNQLQLLTQ